MARRVKLELETAKERTKVRRKERRKDRRKETAQKAKRSFLKITERSCFTKRAYFSRRFLHHSKSK